MCVLFPFPSFPSASAASQVITRKRPTPFTTSTLQQEANSRFGFTSSQTMKLAQELYEEGHISYMRTDSPNMGPEALAVAHKQATNLFGKEDTGADALGGRGKNAAALSAQEAHEAIRPVITEDGRFRQPREVAPMMADKKVGGCVSHTTLLLTHPPTARSWVGGWVGVLA